MPYLSIHGSRFWFTPVWTRVVGFFPSLIFCTANETTIQVMLSFVFLVFLGND